MFLDLYNHIKQLPLLARIIFGLALGAVFIFLFYFVIANYYSVPIEANYFSDCRIYIKIKGNQEKILKLSNEVAKDYKIQNIINANNPKFSVCSIAEDRSLMYIQAKDKSIENNLVKENFFYKKIGKGKYLISKSEELLNNNKNKKLASQIFKKYRSNQDIYIFSNRYFLENSDFKMLDQLCGGDSCYIRGKEIDGGLVFGQFDKKLKEIKGEYLNGFDFVYNKVGQNKICGSNIKEVSTIQSPLWIKLLGMENLEQYFCNNYVLALAKNDDTKSDEFIWQKYRLLIQIDFSDGLGEEKIKDIKYNLKKSVSSLFPTVEEVQLKDKTTILEVKIDPDKIAFNTSSSFFFLDFPDKSATIYYQIAGNILKITNDISLLSLVFAEKEYLALNTKLESGLYGKYVALFETIIVKDSTIFIK